MTIFRVCLLDSRVCLDRGRVCLDRGRVCLDGFGRLKRMVKNAVVFQIFAVSSVQNGWSKNAVAKEKSAQVFLGGQDSESEDENVKTEENVFSSVFLRSVFPLGRGQPSMFSKNCKILKDKSILAASGTHAIWVLASSVSCGF